MINMYRFGHFWTDEQLGELVDSPSQETYAVLQADVDYKFAYETQLLLPEKVRHHISVPIEIQDADFISYKKIR